MSYLWSFESVVRNSPSAITLKSANRSNELERRLAQIIFEAHSLTVTDSFHYDGETRLQPDGPPLGFFDETKAINKSDGKPIFTVTKSRLLPLITGTLVTEDELYWFKDDKFGGYLERLLLSINTGTAHQADVHIWRETRYGEPQETQFLLSLVLPSAEFDRLCRAIWFSKAPCSIRLVVKTVCFQEPAEASLNEFPPDHYAFDEDNTGPAKLESLSVSQQTKSASEIPKTADEEATSTTMNDIKSNVAGITKLLWWIALAVGYLALTTLLRR